MKSSAASTAIHAGNCPFCEQGLLRLWVNRKTRKFLVLCDECELYWADIKAFADDRKMEASGTYPDFPGRNTEWRKASLNDLS